MFDNIYKNKKVLITGHTGFKGSWLSAWLLKLGAEVAGYSIGIPTQPSHFEELNLTNKIEHHLGDIRDFDRLYHVCETFKPEFIFHLAAQPLVRESYDNPRETFDVNMVGTLNVLECIRKLNTIVKVGIMITSDKCYDNVEWLFGYRENDALGGEDPYSGSKGAAELICKSYIKSFFKENYPRVCTVRAGNVIGGGDWAKDRIVPDIIRSWSKSEIVEVRNPNSTRPWQHVLEPLSGYLSLGADLYSSDINAGEPFNFGPNSSVNKQVSEIINEMECIWSTSPGWKDVGSPNSNKKESQLLKLNCDKANILLDWYPNLNFLQTIQFTTHWYQNYYNNKPNVFEFTSSQIDDYINIAKANNIKWATV